MAERGSDDFIDLREVLSSFRTDLKNFDREHGAEPASTSKAATELANVPQSDRLTLGWSIAALLNEFGDQHMTAFIKSITQPMVALACGTCVRSMLEPCALSAWLLDPTVDAHARIERIFALKYEGLIQEQILIGATIDSGSNVATLEQSKVGIDNLEQTAISLGYKPVRNKKGERIGIGQKMPSTTAVIKQMLDEEALYRLLSAVAHGHSWAILNLGFRDTAEQLIGPRSGVALNILEIIVPINYIESLGLIAVQALARAHWNKCRYFGWDEARLEGIVKSTIDKLPRKPAPRWKFP